MHFILSLRLVHNPSSCCHAGLSSIFLQNDSEQVGMTTALRTIHKTGHFYFDLTSGQISLDQTHKFP